MKLVDAIAISFAAPIFITALNPKFVGYFGGGISLAYHIQENLAVELMSSI